MDFLDILMPCIYSFLACMAFSVMFHVGWKRMPVTCLGGALGWFVYLILDLESDVLGYLAATIVIAIYSEIMSRVCKVPATLFLTTAILPLVPGGGMYYTMEHCILGETEQFVETGLHTLALAGAIAVGVILVSSMVRMWKIMRNPELYFQDKIRREDY